MTTLEFQPQFAEIKEKWNAYWAGDVLKRPPVVAHVPKSGEYINHCKNACYHLTHNDVDSWTAGVDKMLDATWYMAESVPFFRPDLGPDMLASFLGCDMQTSETEKSTTWVNHIIGEDELEDMPPLVLDKENPWFKQHQEICKKVRAHAEGRYLVGMPDMHSNLDWLAALRGSTGLCMDIIEFDEEIEEVMKQLRSFYPIIHNAITEASGISTENGGYTAWIPFWCDKPYNVVQCDFLAMLGPDLARKFALPAIEEECKLLDHSFFHLDGKDALRHLDDILAIESLDGVQWVPGAGQKPCWQWLDVFKRIQDAGKKLQVWEITCEQAKEISKHIKPEGVAYCVQDMVGREEVDDLCSFLENNT